MNRRIIAAATLAAALGLAACGGSGTATDTTTTAAAQQGRGASGVKVGDSVAIAELSTKVADAMKKAGTVKVTMTASGETLDGAFSYVNGVEYSLSGQSQGQQMDMIYVGKVLYLGGPSMASMAAGKKWVKIDPKGTDPMSQMMAPLLSSLEQAANPTELLTTMAGVQTTVTKVDGDLVTYETTVTAEQLKAATEKMLGTAMPSLPSSATGGSTITQVVGADGRPTKVTVKGSGDNDVDLTYSDWGAKVDISAPPAAEVGTFDLSGMTAPTG